MARVYRAWDGRLHREVAIKVIDDKFSMPGIGERFLREARAASGLNHPNICTIFDIGEQDGVPYLVMELLEGETLREKISREAISVEDLLRHGAEISDALSAAHARGIIHRDVKPANIFLVKKPNGSTQAKVLDFGLAKIERYASEDEWEFGSQLTSMGATVGTVSYMSPEQARGEKLDARSDLFSLGIVMYEMATGQLPFHGNTSALVFVQLLGQMVPETVRKLNGQIPRDLDQLIMKLLSKNPRGRYQSATELCDELHELAEKRSGWLTRMKPPPVQHPSVPAREGQRRPSSAASSSPLPGPGIVGTHKPKSPVQPRPSDEVSRSLLDRQGDVQRLRALEQERGKPDEAQFKHQNEAHPRINGRTGNSGEGSRQQVAAGRQTVNDLPSGLRPARTSIASNPRMSYPTAAPYQSGLFRTAGSKMGTNRGSGEHGTDAIARLSGLRTVTPNQQPSGIQAAGGSFFTRAREDDSATGARAETFYRLKWIALAIALLVLVGGLLAWRLLQA